MPDVGRYSWRDWHNEHGLTRELRQLRQGLSGQGLFARDEHRRPTPKVAVGLAPVEAEHRAERPTQHWAAGIGDRVLEREAVPDLRHVLVDEDDLGWIRGQIQDDARWSGNGPGDARRLQLQHDRFNAGQPD